MPSPAGAPAGPAVPVPWWLWPNVLALDAPAVAVAWQRFLGRAFGVPVPLAASVVLGLVVWGVYLADRALDARSGSDPADRHRFARRHPRLVAGLAAAALVAGGLLSTRLSADDLRAGAVVAGAVAGYFALVHAAGIGWPGWRCRSWRRMWGRGGGCRRSSGSGWRAG